MRDYTAKFPFFFISSLQHSSHPQPCAETSISDGDLKHRARRHLQERNRARRTGAINPIPRRPPVTPAGGDPCQPVQSAPPTLETQQPLSELERVRLICEPPESLDPGPLGPWCASKTALNPVPTPGRPLSFARQTSPTRGTRREEKFPLPFFSAPGADFKADVALFPIKPRHFSAPSSQIRFCGGSDAIVPFAA